MEKSFFGRAFTEVMRATLLCTVFCLLAEALFAVFVRAFAPSDGVITAVNWGIKCLGILFCSLLFVHAERAFFKGIFAGILSCLLTMLLFGLIGGGLHLTAFYLLELLICAVTGGVGGILGVKLRKE